MAWEGWACFGGVEIISTPRAATYASTAGLPVLCQSGWFTRAALGDGDYDDITDAPWYDAYVPDSKGFLGVLGLSVEGTGGTGASDWTDLLGDGARPGPLRRGPREVEFTTLLLATDQAALAYGLGWLSSALRGDLCDRDCDADELVMMAAQPVEPVEEEDDCSPQGLRQRRDLAAEEDPDAAAWKRGNELQRTLYNCRLLEGPEVVERRRVSGGVVAEVTFTIKAGQPYWYSEPGLVWHMVEDATNPDDFYTEEHEDFQPGKVYVQCEKQREDADCLKPPPDPNGDYDCPAIEPPVRPAKPVDPCYAGTLYPLAWRSLYRVRPGVAAEWFEKAIVIEFENGDNEIRGLLMRWYQNPLQRPPAPETIDADPCAVCAEMWIAYLPPYAKLIVDGRRQQAEVECLGNRVARPVLYGPGGGVFTWPTLDCGTSMILEIVTDGRYGESHGSDVYFYLAARQDAI